MQQEREKARVKEIDARFKIEQAIMDSELQLFAQRKKQEDAVMNITKNAMDFLQRLAQMIEQEGAEDAFRLMSAEFQQLEKSDKQQIEDYLQKQQA